MKKIKEVIVVEGRDDTRRIRESVDADTIETNGSAIDEEILVMIEKAHEQRGVIVFTDPDFPGEKIRKTISKRVPGVKHAFLDRDEARPGHKGSLGIEHAAPEAIRKALSEVYEEQTAPVESGIDRGFLTEMGLLNGPDSKSRRQQLGKTLRIGYTNGKQLKKRLDLFGITKQQVIQALKSTAATEEGNRGRS
ncbi:ribonuclease M5 [Atopococcus tabaci]|uniref:ribonuclease M5 n=1 Tax=Atopococcus tabaci TaxID=269774 RepID=UPI000415587D|nr:ribonuclease M5 [Atopococcus tabaci]